MNPPNRIRETLFADTVPELETLAALYENNYHWSIYETKLLEMGVNDGYSRFYALFERNDQPKEINHEK